MFAVVGKCVFKKAPVSTYEFSIPISLHFLTKLVERIDKRLKHFPFLLFFYRYCEEIIDVGHTRDLFKGLRKPYYSFIPMKHEGRLQTMEEDKLVD